MFQIGTYKTQKGALLKKIIQPKGRWEQGSGGKSPRGNRSNGDLGTTDRVQPLSVSAPRRASSPAFQECEEYCCLLNSKGLWAPCGAGEARLGWVFSFYPCFSV